ncbi:MAG: acyltransferase family protein [Acidimicrobiales bacterium]
MQPQYFPAAANPQRCAARRHRPRLPALDGLRGIGITAVVAYHLDPSWLPGGYLGVDIFFVVSGYLITGLLLGLFPPGAPLRPALAQFWARRARRILPALLVTLFGVAVAASVWAPDAIPELRADIPASLGFVANWRLLAHHDNYFQAIGRPPLLQHLWSLGVEEQFYLVWPFVVLLALAWSRRRGRARQTGSLSVLAFAGAAGSAVLMGALFVPGAASSVYYDTFTHSAGLLIGAGLAATTYGRRFAPDGAAGKRRAQLGAVALAGLVLSLTFLGPSDSFTYQGGILLASALAGLVLLVALRPGPVQQLLSRRPLVYLGTRSYSLYLWHWPVICLTRPGIDVRLSGWALLAFRLSLMGVASEVSYRLVEQPFRTGRAQAALRAWRRAARTAALGSAGACGLTATVLLAVVNPPAMPAALAAGATPAAQARLPAARGAVPAVATRGHSSASTAVGASGSGVAASGAGGAAAGTAGGAVAGDTAGSATASDNARGAGGGTAGSATTPGRQAATGAGPLAGAQAAASGPATAQGSAQTGGPAPAGARGAPTTGAVERAAHDYLAIGDSVLLAASAALSQRLHGDVTVDARVGRQVWAGISRLRQYEKAGQLAHLKALVIDLGTNGPMTPADVFQLRRLAAGIPLLVFVNVRVPRPWQRESNESLAAVAGEKGLRVANWYRASEAPGALYADGVHPDPKGQAIYAKLVATMLGIGPSRPGVMGDH